MREVKRERDSVERQLAFNEIWNRGVGEGFGVRKKRALTFDVLSFRWLLNIQVNPEFTYEEMKLNEVNNFIWSHDGLAPNSINHYTILLLKSFFFFFKSLPILSNLFIYLFLAVLGLRFCVRAFSSCGKRGPLFIAVRGPLTIAASLVVEHRLQTRRLSSCGSRA